MADEHTGPDAIRVYHTGASSHNAAQTDPDLSIGNYKSSSEASNVAWSETDLPANLTVEYIGGNTALGDGTLSFPTVNSVKYTPPGGTIGAEVAIANGETKIVRGGGAYYDQYVRLERTSTDDLTGPATLTITDTDNNAVGFDNVNATDQAADYDDYRCLAYCNDSAISVQNFKFWLQTLGTQRVSATQFLPDSGAGYIEIASGTFDDWPESGCVRISNAAGTIKEVAYYTSRTSTVLTVPAVGRDVVDSADSTEQVGLATDLVDAVPCIEIGPDDAGVQTTGAGSNPGDEETAPTPTPTWKIPITETEAISVGTIASGSHIKLWKHRTNIAGATEGVGFIHDVIHKYDGP